MKGFPELVALQRTEVHVDEIAEVSAFWKGLVNLKDAASMLEITPAQVKALMKLGVQPSVQITPSLHYTQSKTVEELLPAVEQVPMGIPGEGFLPLSGFCRREGACSPK